MAANTDWIRELQTKPNIGHPNKRSKDQAARQRAKSPKSAKAQRKAVQVGEKQFDDKIEQILEFYANEQFHHPLTAQRMRFAMVTWSLRMKAISSLKRLLDVSVAAVLILLSLPIMALTALAIRLESPGPIIFKQLRVGKWGEPFTCYKFRSMYIDAEERKQSLMEMNEADGPVFKIQHDPRITRVGRVIRKLSIDELPQLFNVLQRRDEHRGAAPPACPAR